MYVIDGVCGSTRSTTTIVQNLLPPTREPSLLLTCAVLCFGRGDDASCRAGKIHAHVALDERGPIALAATPELYAVSNVSLAQPKRRRSGKHILEDPYFERNLGRGTAWKGVRKISLQRGNCARGCVSRRSRRLRWLLDSPFDVHWR